MTVSPASGKEIHPRLPWVEIARLLATLVVIMQHVPSMGFPPNQWLIGPALATFFLLAGYFSASGLDEQGAGTWAGRRLLVLLRPYLFWCAAYWLAAGMPLAPGCVFALPFPSSSLRLWPVLPVSAPVGRLPGMAQSVHVWGFCARRYAGVRRTGLSEPLGQHAPCRAWFHSFSLRGSCLGKLYGLFPDCGRLFFRIDCSGLPQLRNYCKSRQPRLVGKAGPVGFRQLFRVLFPYFCSDSPDGRRELFSLPMACLGVVVPGSRGLHDGAERLCIPQTLFPPFPRPDERGKMTFGTTDGKLRRECSMFTFMAPERRHPVSLSWVWHNSLGRQSSGLPLFSPE